MEDNTHIESNDANNKIEIIMRQTDYTEIEAREKLILHDFDHIKVIKSFFRNSRKKRKTYNIC